MGGQQFTLAYRLLFCCSANFCVCVCTTFIFNLSSGKGAAGSIGGGGADTTPPNELASMSPEAMRELLM